MSAAGTARCTPASNPPPAANPATTPERCSASPTRTSAANMHRNTRTRHRDTETRSPNGEGTGLPAKHAKGHERDRAAASSLNPEARPCPESECQLGPASRGAPALPEEGCSPGGSARLEPGLRAWPRLRVQP